MLLDQLECCKCSAPIMRDLQKMFFNSLKVTVGSHQQVDNQFRKCQTVVLSYKLYVLDNLCTKTKVLLSSLLDDLLSLSVQVYQTVNNCDCTANKDPLREIFLINYGKRDEIDFL